MSAKIEQVLRGQRYERRALRRVPSKTAAEITSSVSKRAAILIGVGVMVGSALGGAGSELVRKIALALFGVH